MSVESFYLFIAVFVVVVTLIILGLAIHTAQVRDKNFREARKRVDKHWEEIEKRIDPNNQRNL